MKKLFFIIGIVILTLTACKQRPKEWYKVKDFYPISNSARQILSSQENDIVSLALQNDCQSGFVSGNNIDTLITPGKDFVLLLCNEKISFKKAKEELEKRKEWSFPALKELLAFGIQERSSSGKIYSLNLSPGDAPFCFEKSWLVEVRNVSLLIPGDEILMVRR